MKRIKETPDDTLGRFMSYVLRNHPEAAGLTLDSEGWADVDKLMEGMTKAGRPIDRETLERIVRENNKKRYTLSEDGRRIRANQGHSVDVHIEMEKRTPPERLYHGTADRFLDSIKEQGIRRMARQYVHLSPDVPTAVNVGSRHGKPVVLAIDTAQMTADGFDFFISANGVWQSEDIPWRYVAEVIYPEKGKE